MENQENTQCLQAKKQYTVSGWALFFAALIPVALGMILQWVLSPYLSGAKPAPDYLNSSLFRWAVNYIPIYGMGVPAAWFILRKLPAEPMDQKKMPFKSFLIAFLMCFPIMYVGNIIGNLMNQLISGGQAANMVVEMIAMKDPLLIMTMIFVAPTLEELLFRKLLIDHTVRFGEKNAILFSALAFGLFHCSLLQFFYAFGLGLLFGYIYVRTGRIRYTMIMHFMINFLSGVVGAFCMGLVDQELLGLFMSGDMDAVMALVEDNPQQMISFYLSIMPLMLQSLLTVGLAIAGGILLGMRKKQFFFQAAPEQIPAGKGFAVSYVNAGVICFIVLTLVQTVLVLIQSCR